MTGVEQAEKVSEAGESERGRRGVAWWLLWMAVALVFYVLSIGPVYKLYWIGAVPHWSLVIYSPLGFVASRSPTSERVLDWYVHVVWKVPYVW